MEEYGGVADAIRNAIAAHGGIALINEVCSEISANFGVKESTVRQYAEAPMFVSDGLRVRMRRDDEPYIVESGLFTTRKAAFRFGDRVVLIIDVTSDMLRGSGTSIQPDVADVLGAMPGKTVKYTGSDSELGITWPVSSAFGATLSSVRDACRIHGAEVGHRLQLSFDIDAMTIDLAVVDPKALIKESPLARVHALSGIACDDPHEIEQLFDQMLGHPLAGPIASLRTRGDSDLAEALSELLD